MNKTRKRKWSQKRKGKKNKKNSEWQEKEMKKLYYSLMKSLKIGRKKLKKEEFNFKSKKSCMLKS